jgi:hypothetical protein
VKALTPRQRNVLAAIASRPKTGIDRELAFRSYDNRTLLSLIRRGLIQQGDHTLYSAPEGGG